MLGTIQQARSNASVFLDSRSNDLLLSANKVNSRILLGFSSNFPSSFNLGRSNLVVGSQTSNVDSIFCGKVSVSNNITTTAAITSCNLYVTNQVGIGTTTPSSNYSLHVAGDARVEGNLMVNGSISSVNTEVTISDQILITNMGTGPAFKVTQVGAQPLAEFVDDNVVVLKIFDGGNIALGPQTPSEKLDVAGNAIIRGDIWGSNIYGKAFFVDSVSITSNLSIGNTATMETLYLENLYMGNKLIFGPDGVVSNSNYIPALDTSKIVAGTFTSNFIENYNIISSKLASNLTIAGNTYFAGAVGINTSNPITYPSVRLNVDGGDILVTGQNRFANGGDQARIYLGHSNYVVAASSNVGIVMQVPGTTYPFVLENFSGNLGLGILDPEENLHVAKNAKVNSNVYVSARLSVGTSNPVQTVDIRGDTYISSHLGIGVSNPTVELDIRGRNRIIDDSLVYEISPQFSSNVFNNYIVSASENAPQAFNAFNSNAAVWTGTTPSAALYLTYPKAVYVSQFDVTTSSSNQAPSTLQLLGSYNSGSNYVTIFSRSNITYQVDSVTVSYVLSNIQPPCDRFTFAFPAAVSGSSIAITNISITTFEAPSNMPTFTQHGSHHLSGTMLVADSLGVGTNGPLDKLHIATGNALFGSNIKVQSRAIIGSNGDTPDTLTVYGNMSLANPNGNKVVLNTSNWFLGVNTSNPTVTLDVRGDAKAERTITASNAMMGPNASNAIFAHSNNFNATSYAFQQTSTGETHVNSATNTSILFRNNNTAIAAFTNTSPLGPALGINTLTPTERIDVIGNAKVSSNLYIGAGLGIGTSNVTDALSIVGRLSLSNFGRVTLSTSNNNLGVNVLNPTAALSVGRSISLSNFGQVHLITSNNRIGVGESNPTEFTLDVFNGDVRSKTYVLTNAAGASNITTIFPVSGLATDNPTTTYNGISFNFNTVNQWGQWNGSWIYDYDYVSNYTFDGSFTTAGISGPYNQINGSADFIIQGYRIEANISRGTGTLANYLTVVGSTNNSNWVELDTYTALVGEYSNISGYYTFNRRFNNTTPYRNYRVILRTNFDNNGYYIIDEFRWFMVAGTQPLYTNAVMYSSNTNIGLQVPNPTAALTIGKDFAMSNFGTLTITQSNQRLGINVVAPNEALAIGRDFSLSNNGTIILSTNNSNLGISSSNPSERLEVANGNAKFGSNVYVLNALGVAMSNPIETLSIAGNMSLSNFGKVVVSTSNNNLGVNTASPSERLEVFNGNARVSSNVYAMNALGIASITPTERLDVTQGNAKVSSNVYALNALAIASSNPTERLDIAQGNAKVNSNVYVMNAITIASSNPTERLDVTQGNAKVSSNVYAMNAIAVASSNPTERLDIAQGNAKVSSNVYAMNALAIASSNPSERLDVTQGNAKVSSNVYVMNALSIASSNPSERLDVQGNAKFNMNAYVLSNLSIASSNPTERLDLATGHAKFGSNVYVMSRLAVGHSNPQETLAILGNMSLSNTGSKVTLSTASNYVGVDVTVPSEKVDIQGNIKVRSNTFVLGRLAVASSNPQQELDVQGNIATSGVLRMSSNGIFYGSALDTVSTPGFTWLNDPTTGFYHDATATINVGISGVQTAVYSSSNMMVNTTFNTLNTSTFNSNVNVLNRLGVGKSNPSYTLDVNGDINFANGFLYQNGSLFIGSRWSSNLTGSNIYITTGRVCVGPSNFEELFNVTGGNAKVSSNVYAMNGVGIRTSNITETLTISGNMSLNNFGKVTLTTSNNRLGINNSNPQYTLDVKGDVNFSGGVLYQNGSLFIGSRWSSNLTGSNIYITTGRVCVGPSNFDEFFNVVTGNAKLGSNLYVLQRLGISTSNPSERLDITGGNLKVDSNIYALQRIGIATSNPSVALEINTTDAVLLPKGTTGQRPTVPVQGHIRYNTGLNIFEGFGAGNAWGSLGGVRDTNQDTYITAESFATSNDDLLRFYNSNTETMRISPSNANVYVASAFNSNTSVLARLAVGVSAASTTHALEVQGNSRFIGGVMLSNLGQSFLFTSNNAIGVGTSNPLVTMHINGTDSLLIPRGTTAERPLNLAQGMIRYNSSLNTFEGYGAGNTWGSLGGVRDTNQDTFISAESFATSNDDIIRFFNSNNETMRIMRNGFLGLSNANPSERLELSGGNAKLNSNLYVVQRIGVGMSNPTASIETTGTVKASNGTLGPMIMLVSPIAFADIIVGSRMVLDNSLEAGNETADSNFKPLFVGNSFLYADASGEGMQWTQGRLVFRGKSLATGSNDVSTFVVQDYMFNRSPQYSNITPSFALSNTNMTSGYVTASTPWFTMGSSNMRNLALQVQSSTGSYGFRFGSVYLQFR
jgi:hypothetical protein